MRSKRENEEEEGGERKREGGRRRKEGRREGVGHICVLGWWIGGWFVETLHEAR